MKRVSLIFFIAIIILSSFTGAAIEQDHVVINSKDWRDVYSSILYSNLNGKKSSFLLTPRYASIILYSIPKESSVLAISSDDDPYVKGYESILEANGYVGKELVFDNVNFELAQLLDADINNFIIVDDSYGYNALSVASYADISKSYVLFANDVNIGKIVDYLNSRTVDNLIIFGQVDREVKDLLSPFEPEIINVGDRFDNNLAIVDKYLEIKPIQQATMTSGEFIEDSIMSGTNPVIFIGKNNVPDAVRDYIRQSDFKVGVLIGNELVGPATFIKRQLGISVFVKFAQGSRDNPGSIAEVVDLDRFPMPSYRLIMGISDIRYNIATKQLEVTFQNTEALAVYFLPTITIIYDGQEITVPQENIEPVFLDGNEIKTMGFDLDFQGAVPQELKGSAYVLFGEAPRSMEFAYQAEFDINIIDILDDSEIDILSVLYDKGRKRFEIEVENLKDFDTYAVGEIVNLLINDEFKTYASDKIVHLKPFGKGKIYVRTPDFEDIDYENNDFVRLRVFYGQRENSLIKVAAGEYELLFARGRYLIYGLVIILVILLLLTFILGKKCDNCKTSNLPTAKKCRKCGHRL